MNNASTADGREQERPADAEPFFPSEGSFNTVVPLSEIGRAPAPLVPVDPADVGKPAEAAWAREAHRAGLKEEEETTLVPGRAGGVRGVRRSWVVTTGVIALSVAAGLASGTYLIWSARRAPEAHASAHVTAEAPPLPPAPAPEATPAAEQREAVAKAEKVSEVAKAEKPVEVAHASKEAPPARPTPAPRVERSTRDAAEAREIAPAPKPARNQSAAPARPRVTTAAKQTPAPPSSERALPISAPPSNAKSRKVIQWP
jgi:hypothetical protein